VLTESRQIEQGSQVGAQLVRVNLARLTVDVRAHARNLAERLKLITRDVL
jgi:hypothetical protein